LKTEWELKCFQDGFTPLSVAVQQGHNHVVAVLMENDSRNKVRLPAIHVAAKKDDVPAALLLLQKDFAKVHAIIINLLNVNNKLNFV